MFVFGGILEVTKELNDLLAFNYGSLTFEQVDANGEGENHYHSKFDDNLSSTKIPSHNESHSPSRVKRNSPLRVHSP